MLKGTAKLNFRKIAKQALESATGVTESVTHTTENVSEVLQRIDTLNTALSDISEKLDKLLSYVEMPEELAGEKGEVAQYGPPASTTSDTDDPNSMPWMIEAFKTEGIHERHDADAVKQLASDAGTPISDPQDTPWCAIAVNGWLARAGMRSTGSMRARDFAQYGKPCDAKIGALAVWTKHVAFVASTEPEIEVIGGNQSDKVMVGKKTWYDKYSDFLGYRWPAA